MNHEEFMDKVIGEMTQNNQPTQEDIDNSIQLRSCTGEVFLVDVRDIDWDDLAKDIDKVRENEFGIIDMMNRLLRTTNDTEHDLHELQEMYQEIRIGFENFLTGLNVKPDYDGMANNLTDRQKAIFMAFDAYGIIKEMIHHCEIHNITQALFSFNDDKGNGFNLMDMITEGMLSKDRETPTDDSEPMSNEDIINTYIIWKVTASKTEGGLTINSIEVSDCGPDDVCIIDETNGVLSLYVVSDSIEKARDEALMLFEIHGYTITNNTNDDVIDIDNHDVSGLIDE